MVEEHRPLPRVSLALMLLVACSAERSSGPGPKVANSSRVPVAQPGVVSSPLVSPPGIRLPNTFRPSAQRVMLDVAPLEDRFSGRTEIDGALGSSTEVVWLNADALEFDGASAKVATEEIKAEVLVREDQRVALRFARPLPAGPLTLTLGYRGTLSTRDNRGIFRQESDGEWYAFTQFEETFARRAFPCVDEPSAKIRWTLSLRIPSGLKAVSNTPEESEEPAGPGMRQIRFRTTRPLPSYLVAFGVGRFDIVDGGRAGRRNIPVRIIVPRGRSSEAVYAARISPPILEVLEDYFGMAYPYEKLDLMAIPFVAQFGAMENAGLITIVERLMLARPNEDGVARRRGFAQVTAHEISHQWFGDLVTHAWWNDLWLNEAFATWMATKAIERWAPTWGMAADRVDERDGAAAEDALVTARAIRQPIESYHDIRNAFDSITYEKGAAVSGCSNSGSGKQPSSAACASTSPTTPTATPPRPSSWAPSLQRRDGTSPRRSPRSSIDRASPASAPR